MPLSDAAASVWAKTSKVDEELSLPLYQHLEDAMGVAQLLWDHWLPDSVRRLVGEALPGGDDDGRRLVGWLAGVHDIGKASVAFAAQQPRFTGRMRDAGLDVGPRPLDHHIAPHSLVGHLVLRSWLRQKHGFSRSVADSYAVAVGGHHGRFATEPAVVDVWKKPYLVGDSAAWDAVRDELLSHLGSASGADARLDAWSHSPLPPVVQAVVTGLVIVADWFASDEQVFPIGEQPAPDRLAEAWEARALPPPWLPEAPTAQDVDALLRGRFGLPDGARARSVQRAALQETRKRAPGLMIIESTMGSGKTEAALLVAEQWGSAAASGGVLLALPSQATTDAMFGRLRRWVERLPQVDEDLLSMFLAHGKAGLNEEWDAMSSRWDVGGVGVDESGARGSRAVAHAWLAGRRKGLLASFVVGTIDQLLMAGLRTRYAILRHLAVAGKVVVIDECHAYDAFMQVYLHRVLAWLGAYGVPVAVLSATLSSGTRRDLVAAYRRGALGLPAATETDASLSVLDGEVGYPVLSGYAEGEVFLHAVEDDQEPREVQLERLDDDLETLVDRVRAGTSSGGCVCVIRNTVGRAQEAFAALASALDVEVLLVHSRFLAIDRAQLEASLRDRLGPPASASERPEALVVVGTQVLEQSLDLDFDLMISDVAPVDLLLQRAGRLHRHARGRPPAHVEPTLCLTGVEHWTSAPPVPVSGSRAVYDEYVLLRTLAVLDGLVEVTVPTAIASLVEAVYDESDVLPAEWSDEADRLRSRLVDARRRQRERAGRYAVVEPGDVRGSLKGWDAVTAGDPEEGAGADALGQGRVRDSDESVEVVVVQRHGSEVRLLRWVGARLGEPETVVPTDGLLTDRVARAAAACTVRLPRRLTHPGALDTTIRELEQTWFPAWANSRWLTGQLALVLDETGEVSVAGVRLRYDRRLGLLEEDT